eukprot:Seg3131.2 transcript_id=Seg3131.2/GoldUCD/mRNA.D3Y31 product="hypothetical protein" protein_id=Seg3131.2/GoldUCD/D3Y31
MLISRDTGADFREYFQQWGRAAVPRPHRLVRLCRSKLYGGKFSGINGWAVSVLRYSAGIADWTVEELDYQKRRQEEKIRDWKEKALHGEFVRQTADVAGDDSWRWLRNGYLEKETGLILTAQEQALRTNSIKHSTDKTSETPLCRLCGDSTETFRHIVSGCKQLPERVQEVP